MIRTMKNLLLLMLLLFSMPTYALPTAKLTIKVVDESGQPVAEAKAGIGFVKSKSKAWSGLIGMAQNGKTDEQGLFTAEGETEQFISLHTVKEGYYDTFQKFVFNGGVSGILGFRKWQPWNPTVELVLKKKIKPIGLYAAKIGGNRITEIPAVNKFVGFDLMARDWVVPYGNGIHKDFLFKLQIDQYKSFFEFDATLEIAFSNSGDGLMPVKATNTGSALTMPHHAPTDGYSVTKLIQRFSRTKAQANNPFDYDIHYFFRVRTELDDKGNVKSALYGKIHGPITFGIGKKKYEKIDNSLKFTYYLNPTPNDTNLEFDPEKNLFKDLDDLEKPIAP